MWDDEKSLKRKREINILKEFQNNLDGREYKILLTWIDKENKFPYGIF